MQLDVWEGYAGLPADTLDLEIYQPWLDPASPEDLAAQEVTALFPNPRQPRVECSPSRTVQAACAQHQNLAGRDVHVGGMPHCLQQKETAQDSIAPTWTPGSQICLLWQAATAKRVSAHEHGHCHGHEHVHAHSHGVIDHGDHTHEARHSFCSPMCFLHLPVRMCFAS